MDEENDLIAPRRQKLETLQARPFIAAFPTDGNIAELRAKVAEGATLCAARAIVTGLR